MPIACGVSASPRATIPIEDEKTRKMGAADYTQRPVNRPVDVGQPGSGKDPSGSRVARCRIALTSEWSPPRVSGNAPCAAASPTSLATLSQTAETNLGFFILPISGSGNLCTITGSMLALGVGNSSALTGLSPARCVYCASVGTGLYGISANDLADSYFTCQPSFWSWSTSPAEMSRLGARSTPDRPWPPLNGQAMI